MNDKRIQEIEQAMNDPAFWENSDRANKLIEELNTLKNKTKDTYGAYGAIITILPGAGGEDAEDFAHMLYDMYIKFSVKKEIPFSILDESVRSYTIELQKKNMYALLQHEQGVHRLVRLSPFNAKKLRHTSFARVDVIPILPKQTYDIPSTELSIEFSRSSGPGGQNVNKRETAVRITHIPTGITARVTKERSQENNREKALALVTSKLVQKMKEDEKLVQQGLSISKKIKIEWGNAIRSYVLHPYRVVKDKRTGYEDKNPDSVLAGNIDNFLTT